MPNDENRTGTKARSGRERGIYTRPSAAIERGSGFFIPGLEGSRIRFLFGITVLLADAANHVLEASQPGDWGQAVAEGATAFYGALLLLQGSIELGVEKGYARGGGNAGDISTQNEEGFDVDDEGGGISRVSDSLQGNEVVRSTLQQTAQTIITFTPATYFRFVDADVGALYSSGVGAEDAAVLDTDDQKRLATLALGALSESEGGRVALPSAHPVARLLPEAATRCILLQKVTARACMVIGSDQLLPSFTKNDLRWIGQLAGYNNLISTEA